MYTKLDSVQLRKTVRVMRRQEETNYKCCDYLGQIRTLEPESSGAIDAAKIFAVDEGCRVKMAHWCFQVIDHANFQRETVNIAMAYLDRFLSSKAPQASTALTNRRIYQLVAMTCLYISIKLFEPMRMGTALLSELSRGCYSVEEILRTECDILSALKWRLHGPTTFAFVEYFLALFPDTTVGHSSAWELLLEVSRYQTELAVGEYYFVTTKPSIVAIASILNGLHKIPTEVLSRFERVRFLCALSDVAGMNVTSSEVYHARKYLAACYLRSCGEHLWEGIGTRVTQDVPQEYDQMISDDEAFDLNFHAGISPVCVSRDLEISDRRSRTDKLQKPKD